MSVYSGKCDFYDCFVAIRCDGAEGKINEQIKTLKLYVYGEDGRPHRVKSDTLKDISKYFPYLTSTRISNKESFVCYLSSDSFIDQEEQKSIQWKANYILKYWRKCKRNKIPFTVQGCKDSLWFRDDENLTEMIRRVEKDGNKADFSDIHFSLWEWNRRSWFEVMVELGWSEIEAYQWCFKGLFDPPEVVEKRLGRPLKED